MQTLTLFNSLCHVQPEPIRGNSSLGPVHSGNRGDVHRPRDLHPPDSVFSPVLDHVHAEVVCVILVGVVAQRSQEDP